MFQYLNLYSFLKLRYLNLAYLNKLVFYLLICYSFFRGCRDHESERSFFRLFSETVVLKLQDIELKVTNKIKRFSPGFMFCYVRHNLLFTRRLTNATTENLAEQRLRRRYW